MTDTRVYNLSRGHSERRTRAKIQNGVYEDRLPLPLPVLMIKNEHPCTR